MLDRTLPAARQPRCGLSPSERRGHPDRTVAVSRL